MCGFTVITNSDQNTNNLDLAFSQLRKINKHRGPDDFRILHKKKYSILFNRLSILDLNKRSTQPLCSDDGKIQIVFNGVIYNYIEIKNELRKYNIKFKTTGDTEVILKSYQLWGADFVKKLRGMFSIIILDDLKKKYFCFRDNIGQKPLFYSKYKNGLIFSSEIKDIIFFKKKIEIKEKVRTVEKFLYRGWCDDNKDTFFENIYSFPAASLGVIKKTSLDIKKYWKLDINKNNKFDRDEFDEIYTENIKNHIGCSDVPIAFTLSGGLDSSSIVKKSLELNLPNGKAYSLFNNDRSSLWEKKYIDKFIKENRINHSYINLNKNYENDILEKFISFQDEPTMSGSFINQYILNKRIKEDKFKVLLNGEGGDEVLGGYNRMIIPYIYEVYIKPKKEIPDEFLKNSCVIYGENFDTLKKKITKYTKKLKTDNDIEHTHHFKLLNINKEDINQKLNFYNKSNPQHKNSFKGYLLEHLFKRDIPHILRATDRNSMSQSIESRTPFLDQKFIEYVFSIDTKFFMLNGVNKFMLRSIMKNKLPNSYLNKTKIGRPGIDNNFIFHAYYEKFIDILDSNISINKYFDNKKLRKNLISDKKNQNYINKDFYFRVLNYLIWKKNFNI